MWDYDYLREMSKGISTIFRYGTTEADIVGRVVKSEPFLEVSISKGIHTANIHSDLVGEYNLPNILAAVTVGRFFQVPDDMITEAIENYTPSNSRSQLVEKGNNKIILDAYNANPSSMKLAIENFAKLNAENKILALGAMAELGVESLEEHKAIVKLIGQYKWKDVILVGGDFLKINHPYISFSNSDEAKQWYTQQQFENSSILVKGSRSMQMEKLIQ
jgi:UDP-N-acetylmuramoyl-tripeptide--D-alanyl-D-alanine ligase